MGHRCRARRLAGHAYGGCGAIRCQAALATLLASIGGFFVGSLAASVGTALLASVLRGARARYAARWLWGSCGGLLLLLGYTTLATCKLYLQAIGTLSK